MDSKRSAELYEEACLFWDVLTGSFDRDELDWDEAIHNNILGPLAEAFSLDPNNLDVRRMRIEMIGEEMGAYEEALEEAEELVLRAPNHVGYRELRDRIQKKFREERQRVIENW